MSDFVPAAPLASLFEGITLHAGTESSWLNQIRVWDPTWIICLRPPTNQGLLYYNTHFRRFLKIDGQTTSMAFGFDQNQLAGNQLFT